MPSQTLLPPKSTELERAIANVLARNVTPAVSGLWNAQTCPVPLLPWLAHSLQVDVWDETWPEAQKREAVSQALAIAKRRGTVGAVKRALKIAGFDNADVTEGTAALNQNQQAACSLDGNCWAYYGAILNGDELPQNASTNVLIALLESAQNVRSVFAGIKLINSKTTETVSAEETLLTELKNKTTEALRQKTYNGKHQYNGGISYQGQGLTEMLVEYVGNLTARITEGGKTRISEAGLIREGEKI